MRRLPGPLLAITDHHACRYGLGVMVDALLDGGCRWIWFRDTDLASDERCRLGGDLLARVRPRGGRLTIGRDAALAAALGADGVHLPGGTGPAEIEAARRILPADALVGVSAHGPTDLSRARDGGADYATLSPVFESVSKPGYGPALGAAGLVEACRLGIPIVALGGVTPATAPLCRRAGATAVAAMGGLMRAPDPAGTARNLLAAWERI
ncbi:thiamine phosphate synthase [Methylobacterium oxalidis]|uniref:Thiamine-phosphate synthase n=1 Tax=Methylobacterium oxalidis TaxID=944322 RepID=A0A512J3Q7_9HYPH|nr:thiamine phosphate synthase [Methylobacterium oxalidis]GEP04627.1 putative thiamine-phosphate synthase [Methylobacterium oxalidis]GJE30959.1 Thiamine-phosphate synthase [Methylobacterium oxalidis]GLS62685.1 putative thiamine-phosphate synthase [Methylobacterium oxalidis]